MIAADAFRSAMLEKLGAAPCEIIGDGKIHRFATGKKRDDAGWYQFFDDDFPAGTFGDWRSRQEFKWRMRETRDLSPADRERLRRTAAEREKRREREYQQAAKAAQARWQKARPADQHEYLQKKRVGSHRLRQESHLLLVPVTSDDETIISLQTIPGEGKKLFTPGSRTKGGYFTIGEPTATIIIGEGYATLASLYQATGFHCVVAFTASNLKTVSQKIRAKHPQARIVFAADDDLKVEKERGKNPGIEGAKEAAPLVHGVVAVPPFDRNKDGDGPSDWNDYAERYGEDAMASAFQTAADAAAHSTAGNGHDKQDDREWIADDEGPTPEEPEGFFHARGEPAQAFTWPDPQPIPGGLPPVAAFQDDFLPMQLRPWIMDIAERMQCPPDFVGIPAIVALGSVIGRRIGIRPQRRSDWIEVANLWGCIVGRPGALKSPAMNEVLKPLRRLESEARKEHEAALKTYEKEAAFYKIAKDEATKAARKAFKNGCDASCMGDLAEPEAPQACRLITEDTSYEALGEILADNPYGTLAFRDELVSLLKALDREEYAATRGFYLTAWNGTSGYSFDRIIRGRVHIEAICLSLLGSTQPGRLAEYIHRAASGDGDDGLIQRFGLLVWPDQSPQWRDVDRYPDSEARRAAWDAFSRLNALDPHAIGAERDEFESVPFLHFDAPAQNVFREWRGDLERRLRSDELPNGLESHLAKYRKLVPSLALINHLADAQTGPIAETTLCRALAFAEYLETHARRAYGCAGQVEATAAKLILAHIRKGELTDGFTARELWRRKWSGLAILNDVKAGLDLLADLNWIAPQSKASGAGGGRPTAAYIINPKALQ
ncbi:DUF3987 domain-containing protein [Methylocystis suflitae]|uniref:DUF3987 domain-containing protein n=1 Tax=Methylocystis suflitae TaxID=2951405 RepID=UPI002109E689|nr:DUF3987 domain-containing protein [Methylocystis suflitae]MCQ4190750.1 DUF3987 domain-containing protein [Methylocystis suflitae]